MELASTKNGSPKPLNSETREKSIMPPSPEENGWLLGVSHASPTVLPEESKPPGTSAIFGLNVGECYANYDQGRHCLRMFQGFLIPMEDGFSTELCLTFTGAGMMRNGKLFRLLRPGHCTSGSEYGSSPTPLIGTPTTSMSKRSSDFAKGRAATPVEYVAMWPTPDVRGFTNEGSLKMLAEMTENEAEFSGMAYRTGGKKKTEFWPTPRNNSGPSMDKKHLSLDGAVRYWPTPTAYDWNTSVKSRTETGTKTYRHNLKEAVLKYPTPGTSGLSNGSGNCEAVNKLYEQGQITEEERRSMRSGNGGKLNADWVEALMGYPQGWTDIDKEADMENRYPEKWLDGTWEDSIPRLAVKQPHRVSRLKCLGNAVVPQIPMMIWLMIKAAF